MLPTIGGHRSHSGSSSRLGLTGITLYGCYGTRQEAPPPSPTPTVRGRVTPRVEYHEYHLYYIYYKYLLVFLALLNFTVVQFAYPNISMSLRPPKSTSFDGGA